MAEQAIYECDFDATDIAPASGFALPLPNDWYDVVLTNAEVKNTADNSGRRLIVTMKVIDGEFASRQIYESYNIKNKSEGAERIGKEGASALFHAIGILKPGDLRRLLNIPFQAHTKIKAEIKEVPGTSISPAVKGYPARNEVNGHRSAAAGAAERGMNPQQSVPSTAPTMAPSMPPSRPPAPAAPQAPQTPAPMAMPVQQVPNVQPAPVYQAAPPMTAPVPVTTAAPLQAPQAAPVEQVAAPVYVQPPVINAPAPWAKPAAPVAPVVEQAPVQYAEQVQDADIPY